MLITMTTMVTIMMATVIAMSMRMMSRSSSIMLHHLLLIFFILLLLVMTAIVLLLLLLIVHYLLTVVIVQPLITGQQLLQELGLGQKPLLLLQIAEGLLAVMGSQRLLNPLYALQHQLGGVGEEGGGPALRPAGRWVELRGVVVERLAPVGGIAEGHGVRCVGGPPYLTIAACNNSSGG